MRTRTNAVKAKRGWNTRGGVEIAEPLTNAEVAELLAREGEGAPPPLNRAFRRASRRALMWEVEAAELWRERGSLTDLTSVGPYLEKVIVKWIEKPEGARELLKAEKTPDLRRNFLTWTEAQTIIAAKPELASRVKGDLQMHTEWSDGEATVEEMGEAAVARGYEYIAITDHAKGLKIAGGIDEAQLAEQGSEISAVNARLERRREKLWVLRSIELNLNPRGEGDMSTESLAELDVVLGCFHSSLRRKEEQTERYLAALRNPTIQILGHPRGRIFNFRMGLQADWARVFGLAAKLDKAMEIDCYPDRQDLSGDLLKIAKREGCRISLGTDAHGSGQLRFLEYGVAAATKAGIKVERVINTMGIGELREWVEGVREGR